MTGPRTIRPPRTPKDRLVKFAACEGHYAASVYLVALLGGLGVLIFLSDAWTRGILLLALYVLLIFGFLRYAESKRSSADKFVVSFSRSNTTIICDIAIQTVRMSVISILVDLIGNQKLTLLFNDKDPGWYQGRLWIAVIVLSLMLAVPIVYGYHVQAAVELEDHRETVTE